MGMLSDFVVADKSDSNEIGESIRPAEKWLTLEGWKGIDAIRLATLYCAIKQAEFTNEVYKLFTLVGGNKEDGPWVFNIPENIIESLSILNGDQIEEVARRWVQTEELTMDDWSIREAMDFIGEISTYAKKAKESNKCLFLWFSM